MFDAQAAERFFFDVKGLNPNHGDWVSWRLLDPLDRPVFGPSGLYLNNDVDTLALALAGRYTLLVEGRIWAPANGVGAFDYSFNVTPVIDDAPTGLVLGEVQQGNLAGPGQRQEFNFSLGEPRSLYFDTLLGTSLSWTLSGPDGYTLSRGFNSSDSYELGAANPLLRLAVGDYKLTVDGNGDTVGDYAFRLVDPFADASAIGLSAEIAGTLEPSRETHFYKFDAVAGERYFFDRIVASDYWNTTYRLFDPLGNQVWGNGYIWPDDQETTAFARTGTYLLMVEGRIGNGAESNAYSFNIQRVSDIQAALDIGATTSGSITHAGQRASYTFSLTEARQLLFDALAPNNNVPDFRWSLSGPRGDEVSGRQLYSSESHELGGTSPLLNLIAGDYTLVIDPIDEQRGDFAFRLLDLADAAPVAVNTLVAGTLNPANQTHAYRFDGSVGTQYYIDRQLLSSGVGADWLSWRLFDADGRQVFGPLSLNDVDLFTLPHAGAYTLIVEPRIWTTQHRAATDYSFKLLEISDDLYDIVPGVAFGTDRNFAPGKIGGAASVGTLRTVQVADNADTDQTGSFSVETWFKADTLAQTWQAIYYKGNGNSNQRTYSLWLHSAGFLHLSTGDNGNQTIQTAAGLINPGTWYHAAAVFDRNGTVMKLYLDGAEVASGALRATPARDSSNPLQIGGTVESGSYAFRGAIDEFRLWDHVLGADEIAARHAQPLAGDEAGLLLYLKADETSGSTLADASGRGNTGTVNFAWAGTPGVVAGVIDFGQKDVYRFSLAEDTPIYFDSLSDDSRLLWTLTGPRGTVVSARPMQSSDAANGTSIFNLVAGDYTLFIDGQGDANGEYGFRLLPLADAPTMALDSVVSGQLAPANSTNAYRFAGTAGERIYFDMLAYSGGIPYWRLLDPFGNTVWGPNYLPSDDVQIQTLASTGVYTLLVEGRRDAGAGASSYSLRAQRVSDLTVPISLDGEHGVEPLHGAGRFGGALQFNGLQAAEVAHGDAIDLRQTLTVEAWVKVDAFADTWTPIIYKGGGSDAGDRTYSLWLHANGAVNFTTGDGGAQSLQSAGGLVGIGQWHHIAAVMDRINGQMRLLVDGVQVDSGTVRKTQAFSSATPLVIGANVEHSASYANLIGSIDEVRLWNVLRSNDEIAAGKDAALNGDETGLVAYWKFDETAGAALADATGHGHQALLRSVVSPVVAGRIDHAGQRVAHTFTLDAPFTRLYFDSLTASSEVVWSLSGPRGLIVADRRFDQSDSQNGSSFFDLPAGDYTLTVDGVRDFTGGFAFRLLDLADAAELTPGTAVSGVLAPARQTDAYAFDASAGERYYFDRLSGAGGATYWRLLDPFGRTLWGPDAFSSDVDSVELPYGGRYTLLIEGRRDPGGDASYSFNVVPVVHTSSALSLGDVVSASLDSAGAVADHTFTLDSARRLYFDSLLNSTAFKWSLTGPRGTVVTPRSMADSDSADYAANPVLDLVAGDYTLRIDADGATTGAYGFRLVDLSSTAQVSALALGSVVSGTLDGGNRTHLFSFDAAARDRFAIDLLSESRNTPHWRLISPNGTVLSGPTNADDFVATLPISGRYVLLLEGRVSEGNVVDYSFRVDDTVLPNTGNHVAQNFDDAGLPYAPAAFSNAAPALVAEAAGNVLRLIPGTVTGINTVGFTSTHPGVTPASVTVDFDLRITKVNNQGDGIGFAWLNADAWGNSGPAPQFGEEPNLARSFGVGFDTVNNGEVSDNHVSLHFDGAKLAEFNLSTLMPGFRLDSGAFHHARVVLAAVSGGSNVSVYLTPNGGSEAVVVENYFVSGLQAYDGRVGFGARNGGNRAHNDIDNVAINVVAGTPEALPQIVFGETVSATLSSATERDRYTFTLTEAKRIAFDSLTVNVSGGDSFYLRWFLRGPDGSLVVSDRAFRQSDSHDGSGIVDLAAGTYTLTIEGRNNISGAYSFRLLDLADATVLTRGEAVSGTLNPANQTQVFSLDASAGEKIYLDMTARSGGDAYWRVLDPFGRTVYGPRRRERAEPGHRPAAARTRRALHLLARGALLRHRQRKLRLRRQPRRRQRGGIEPGRGRRREHRQGTDADLRVQPVRRRARLFRHAHRQRPGRRRRQLLPALEPRRPARHGRVRPPVPAERFLRRHQHPRPGRG